MSSGGGDGTWLPPGFPIRKPPDLSSVASSPGFIAGSNVLHRLLVPRHPPCALNNLTTKMKMLASTVQFSSYGRDDSNRDRRLHHSDDPEVAAVAVAARMSPAPSCRPEGGGPEEFGRSGRSLRTQQRAGPPPRKAAGHCRCSTHEQPPWDTCPRRGPGRGHPPLQGRPSQDAP